jgi:hypothetical protein
MEGTAKMICPAKFPDEECDEPACQTDGCIINTLCNESRQSFVKTIGRKICPRSGEKCDCPKGQCFAAIDSLLSTMVDEAAMLQEHADEAREEYIAAENDAAQADSLEAHSLKYQACAQIMQLSSGKFALFGAYRAGGGSGIALIVIGEWADLEEHVRNYKELADAAWARGQERTLPAKTAADYENLFGEES